MLLTLSLVYLLARHRAVSGHPLGSRDELVSCDSSTNSRSLFTILTSCLITVFACTWVSVHPNVPPPNQSKLALLRRRLGLMLVAVIAPELMAGFAVRQFIDARWFAEKYNVSMTHGFFFAMGGFVSKGGHHPITTPEQLCLEPEYVAAIQSIEAEVIEDKSKGDSMSKGVALLQGLWFIAQCLSRVHQDLPLTQLEVATLAFQFVSVFIWVLWWYKPLDVQQPILIGSKPFDVQQPVSIEPVLNGPRANGPADELVGVGLIGRGRRFMCEVVGPMLDGVFCDFDPSTSTFVPAFWSTHGLEYILSARSFHSKRLIPYMFPQCLIGTIFGVVHCAAWHTYFPSNGEMLLWRACSLVIALMPLVLGVGTTLVSFDYLTVNDRIVTAFLLGIPLLAYSVARIILCAIAFTTLRALPPNAFVDVDWTTYIPHL
ncbi:hypothetical protein MSAN_00409500 [Mycena sanguinolenta]|uniref:Uncharacterized protein n=1 Tax=Mycena sanguinolenta TaxID=230812 RepID=A0A8H6ZDC4_9AGAR|nr:hypothetical protein MSAN_00409500 [Mycena sanguinolenta]